MEKAKLLEDLEKFLAFEKEAEEESQNAKKEDSYRPLNQSDFITSLVVKAKLIDKLFFATGVEMSEIEQARNYYISINDPDVIALFKKV